MTQFGPGTFKVDDLDVEVLLNALRITNTKTTTDPKTHLAGNVTPGRTTYVYALAGNIDLDSSDPRGVFALSQIEPGTQHTFEFTPSTAGETSASGIFTIDPLTFGADNYGDDLASDFEWTLVGRPVYTFPDKAPARSVAPIVINGAPGPVLITPHQPGAKSKAKSE